MALVSQDVSSYLMALIRDNIAYANPSASQKDIENACEIRSCR